MWRTYCVLFDPTLRSTYVLRLRYVNFFWPLLYRDISNPFLKKLLLGGMPWCYDDPNSAEQLMDILLNGTTSGNLLSSGSCGVSPIATANNHIMHQLASMDKRYVVVCIQQ